MRMVVKTKIDFWFTSALILAFSPGEKEQLACVSGDTDDCPANPAHELSGRRRVFLPPAWAGRGGISVKCMIPDDFPKDLTLPFVRFIN